MTALVPRSRRSFFVAEVTLERDRCAVLWARIGEGISAPIYANCAF